MTYASARRETLSDGFAALADPTRRAVFERVAKRAGAVGEIAAGLPISRPAVSQHLAVLETAGLVGHERAGTRNVYRLEPRGLEAMHKYLDRFWDRALAAFKEAAERETDE